MGSKDELIRQAVEHAQKAVELATRALEIDEDNNPAVPTVPAEPSPGDAEEKPAWKIYLERYPSVAAVPRFNSPEGAFEHYTKWGKAEGKIWGKPAIPDESLITNAKPYHHYNPRAWTGETGSAIVLCEGQHARAVRLDGRPFQKHGSLDKNREVWTLRFEPGLSGVMEIEEADKTHVFRVDGSGGMIFGDCA